MKSHWNMTKRNGPKSVELTNSSRFDEGAKGTSVKSQPLPKIEIPQTWSSAQALCVIDFLHLVAGEIWDWYERPILEFMERRNNPPRDPPGQNGLTTSYKSDDIPDDDLPF